MLLTLCSDRKENGSRTLGMRAAVENGPVDREELERFMLGLCRATRLAKHSGEPLPLNVQVVCLLTAYRRDRVEM